MTWATTMAILAGVATGRRRRARIRTLAAAAALGVAAAPPGAADSPPLHGADAQAVFSTASAGTAGRPADTGLPVLGESAPEPSAAPSPQTLHRRNALLIGGGALAIGAYGLSNWWQDGFTGRFRAQNEGWFGQNTAQGGADKFGHAYATYVGVRLLARGFEEVGNAPRDALELATWSALATFTAVEVADAFSRRFRFSREDAIMNFAGAGLAWLLETRPELDRLIDFRLQYRPSADARHVNQVDPISDHSGQTYLLAAKASGVPALRQHGLLRYLEFAVGFGSRGYDPDLAGSRSRHAYVGVSLNLTEVLRATVFRNATTPGPGQRVTEGALEIIQIPGTAVLVDHRL